jgi:hypothetical protein
MDPWEAFLKQTLLELRNGAKIPQYFGCLIPLLAREVSPVLLTPLVPALDPKDDVLSLDVIRPRQSPPPTNPSSSLLAQPRLGASTSASHSPPAALQDSEPSFPSSPQRQEPSFDAEEEEEQQSGQPERRHFAEHFRAIGDQVFDQLWPAVMNTELPRVTRESKCWVEFRVEKYKRRRDRMLEQPRLQKANNRLMFVRPGQDKSQNSE